MTDVLALRQARRHVENFNDELKLMTQHREAMDCLDCEAFLQVGIDAYTWLVRADETIRKAIYLELAEYDPKTGSCIQELFRAWLNPCSFAHWWIDQQLKRGFQVDNLKEFRECENQVRAIVNSFDSDALTDPMRGLRDSAVTEHSNGETAEFV
jgi:hypothetical protein